MHFKFTSLVAAAFLASTALANPIQKRGGCVFTSYSQISGVTSCTSITLQGPFTVPANSVINLSGLKTGITVKITGVITFAHGTLDDTHYLLTISGSSLNIDGSTGTLDGSGTKYWDGQGANNPKNPKPKFINLQAVSGSLHGLTVIGSPIHTFSINSCNGLNITGVTIDNHRFANYLSGHNTDGFDIGGNSNQITISGATVYNNDDCLAVNSGTNIFFRNNFCSGSHGISIGSIKAGKVVDGVWVTDCTVVNSANGVRIKTYADATGGRVHNINYQNIALSNITNYGIIIQQDYTNAGSTGKPGGGASISGVTLSNIHGTVKGGKDVYILCANCNNFNFENIAVTGGSASSCSGISPKPKGC